MRIAFDVTSCTKPHGGGIQNYGRGVVRACARADPGSEHLLAVRPNRWLRRRLVRDMLDGRPVRLLVDGLERMTLGRIDLLHSVGARLPARGDFARIATLHDLRVFERSDSGSVRWRRERQERLRETAARADCIIALSRQGARSIAEHLGVADERVRVVPGPIDTDRFRRREGEALSGALARYALEAPYLLSVGRPGRRKNHLGLLAAFARAEVPEAWLLVFAGPEGAGAKRLREKARELGITDERLRLPGHVPDADLPLLLSGCGAYVCASLHEGFGRPVAEAQACGAPIVSSNRGGLSETVGDCGVLFDPADLDDFAAALSRVTNDEALRRSLAARGPERARRLYSEQAVGAELVRVYREVCAGADARRCR